MEKRGSDTKIKQTAVLVGIGCLFDLLLFPYLKSLELMTDPVPLHVQIWKNVASLQKGGEVMELVSNLSQLFEDLFQKQVYCFAIQ